ncbi:MAG: SAM-dependent DNA methyltransferase [Acinetobacter sp.]|nr:SAM-dependent DNA methyltransferase [Acinetobacter sp.]
MTNNNFSQVAAFIWSVADLLRGDFKQSQYGRVILPFTLLRRLDCVFEPSKAKVLEANEKVKAMPLPEEAKEKMLLKATEGLSFFNTSELDLSSLGQKNIRANISNYIQHFSKDAREIFEHFKFDEFTGLLDDANLLYKVVQKFASTDLSPQSISNHDMGLVFEELIRRFAESSNETAGEHFTPRDIVRLTTGLIFSQDDDALNKEGVIRTIYDPTAGTGGFLSSGTEYVYEHNPEAVMRVFGQELNPESYAICKADMLIKGQDVSRIKLGNTLSNDQLVYEKFDYMLSNPPFGVDWKKIEQEIKDEHEQKGFNGRFGAGLPRVSDGSLLFLMHLISKMRDVDSTGQGSRIGIILNGSPLFTGSAGSGESEIRRYILEADLLEAIIALPTDMFYNTGIATYVWVLSNKKEVARKGKVHLIDGSNLYSKMRKSLGSKRNEMSEDDIKMITSCFGDFEVTDAHGLDKPAEIKSNRGRQSANPKNETVKTFASKIFNSYEFGYRRVTIERPLRLSAQLSDVRINRLKFSSKFLDVIMETLFVEFGQSWNDESYGDFSDVEVEARAFIKANYPDIKEKDVKNILSKDLWIDQKSLFMKAKMLQGEIGLKQFDDMNEFSLVLKRSIKNLGITLDSKEQKLLLNVVSWKNPEAQPVVKKVLKTTSNSLYGHFEYKGEVVEFEQDGDLRDAENIALDPSQSTTDLIESYFKREVQPHVLDAWINADKRDAQDGEIGLVGYEIPFNRHFYVYQPPRDLTEIDADLDAVSSEIMTLLQEVHS